jgi:hypothetical protein
MEDLFRIPQGDRRAWRSDFWSGTFGTGEHSTSRRKYDLAR